MGKLNSKLIEKFPEFPLYDKEELEKLSPERLIEVFNKLNEIKENVNGKTIQLKTQIESVEENLEETKNEIFKKYSVKSLEELNELKEKEMIKFQKSYEKLISLEI
jgi:hypothetical protein